MESEITTGKPALAGNVAGACADSVAGGAPVKALTGWSSGVPTLRHRKRTVVLSFDHPDGSALSSVSTEWGIAIGIVGEAGASPGPDERWFAYHIASLMAVIRSNGRAAWSEAVSTT